MLDQSRLRSIVLDAALAGPTMPPGSPPSLSIGATLRQPNERVYCHTVTQLRAAVLLLLLASVATGCQPPAIVSSLPSVSVALAGGAASIADDLDRAHRFAHASGIPDLRDGLDRLAEAWSRPGTPGGVVILIEPTRFSDAINPIHTRPRTVRLWPDLADGVVHYTLKIDSARYRHSISGPAELALYLFAASLRRDWYEAKRMGGLRDQTLLDDVVADPHGLLTAHFRTWERVIDRAYLPLRSANLVQPIAELDALTEGRALCPRTADPDGCWRSRVRSALNLKDVQ